MEGLRLDFIPSTPKRKGAEKKGKAGFYDFYPGYSPTFVADVLQFWELPKGSVILDPWNGSGTTTDVSSSLGFHSIGFDLNPIMFIVAKAKSLQVSKYNWLKNTKEQIMRDAKNYRNKLKTKIDPLSDWFVDETVDTLRLIERAVQSIFPNWDGDVLLFKSQNGLLSIPSEMAFFYLALFRVMKEMSFSFRTTNPTWIKKPKEPNKRQMYSREYILQSFEKNVDDLLELLLESVQPNEKTIGVKLGLSNSMSLPLDNGTIDAVITSPPYCTRIDYAILTRLELALLGCSDTDLANLRKQFIGSPLTRKDEFTINNNWGSTCSETIEKIMNHSSKASATYYQRTYMQYFQGLYQSLEEINRVLKKGGRCAIVVQDSYYKDLYIDLGKILSEMGESFKWKTTHQFNYYAKQSMIWLNTKSNQYRDDNKGKEVVLFFRKGDE